MHSRVAFIHGRPGPHPMHAAFAKSVGADFSLVDEKLRSHDGNGSRLRRYISWFVSALLFSKRSQYTVFLTEGPQFPAMIMRQLHLLNAKQITVVLLDNETLYFLREHRYSERTTQGLGRLLAGYDALVCVGQMESELARQVLGAKCPPIYTVFNGVSRERGEKLAKVKPNLETHHIVCIANGTAGWRVWYKGMDLLLDTCHLILGKDATASLSIVGKWEAETVSRLLTVSGLANNARVEFVGASREIERFLQEASLYVHCGRGDAFGISVLEAMAAGIVPIVSEWTGSREVVSQVSEELIAPLDEKVIAERIEWYFALPKERRQTLSDRCREVASKYTEELATEHFAATFNTMLSDFGLPRLAGRLG